MKPARSPKLFYSILFGIALSCCVCLIANPLLLHYVYAPLEAPFCAARIARKLHVAPNHSAIIEYYETNLKPGMSRSEVREAFSVIAPVRVDPGQHHDYIVFKMCSEPLNNLIFWAYYTEDDKLIDIEEDTFP